eukprot:TRINITY_DN5366_c0_g1_i2.p1 TRINITY_DN5366_c0_g1~~TRINITY_DN5366_c0_g1_i2.p1  ORF type:complete len:589 (-),score=104.86 TRINITY_DN5366_c0_g1_i2:549-2315(-)
MKWSAVWCVSVVLVVFAYGQNCLSNSCNDCLSLDGCNWCAQSQSCFSETDTSKCGYLCTKKNINQCPKTSCGNIRDCKNCAENGCHWCGAKNICIEASTTGEPCSNSCDNPLDYHCWKSDPRVCPDIRCDEASLTDCSSCTKAGCAWCGSSRKCMESTTDGKRTCGSIGCGSSSPTSSVNQLDCWKIDTSDCPNPDVYRCDDLSSKGCKECTENGCVWCGSEKKCMEGTINKQATCTGFTCNGFNIPTDEECWKGDPNMCPDTNNCEDFSSKNGGDCKSCVEKGCHWCGREEKCMESTANGRNTCDGFSCDGWSSNIPDAYCWKGSVDQCPDVPKCSTINNCRTCTENNCAWCGIAGLCFESDIELSKTCFGDPNKQCGEYSQSDCWKTSKEQCPEGDTPCKDYNSCAECTLSGCGWCGKTNTCIESSTSSLPCIEGICGNIEESSSCYKNEVDMCPTSNNDGKLPENCEELTSCKSCTDNSNCGWCSQENTCYESRVDKLGPCGDVECNGWNQGSCEVQCNTHGTNCLNCERDESGCGICNGRLSNGRLIGQCVASVSGEAQHHFCQTFFTETCPGIAITYPTLINF